jgi:hypothetical protein
MSSVFFPWTALSYLRNAVWTPTSACVVAVVVLGFLLPKTGGPAELPNTHPDTCRACASTTPEARAKLDATLIAMGAIEAPSASKSL